MSGAKRLVRSLFLRAGLDIHRLTPASDPYAQIHAAIKANEIDLVLDVGANAGQFASALRAIGYGGPIVSFEPLSAAHAKLTAAAKGDSRWTVHPQCALGDRDGETEINVAGNSVSSSVLPMTRGESRSSRPLACAICSRSATRSRQAAWPGSSSYSAVSAS